MPTWTPIIHLGKINLVTKLSGKRIGRIGEAIGISDGQKLQKEITNIKNLMLEYHIVIKLCALKYMNIIIIKPYHIITWSISNDLQFMLISYPICCAAQNFPPVTVLWMNFWFNIRVLSVVIHYLLKFCYYQSGYSFLKEQVLRHLRYSSLVFYWVVFKQIRWIVLTNTI